MTDRQLAEKMAGLLEESIYIGAWTAPQLIEWQKRVDEALAAFREAGKGKCRACKGRGWIPIPEGSAVCEKCEGRGCE